MNELETDPQQRCPVRFWWMLCIVLIAIGLVLIVLATIFTPPSYEEPAESWEVGMLV